MNFDNRIADLIASEVKSCAKCSHCIVFKDSYLNLMQVKCHKGFWEKEKDGKQRFFDYKNIPVLKHMTSYAKKCPEYDRDKA